MIAEQFMQKKWAGVIVLIVSMLIFDQICKYFILQNSHDIPIKISDFFNLVLVQNKGIAFGMFNNNQYSNILFATISMLILFFILYLMITDYRNRYIFALIVAGSIGNIMDRICYGAVLDFFDFYYGKYHWPAFNVADSLIFIGATMLLLSLNEKGKNEKH